MVRAETIEKIGVFDEYYYTFQSEADWCLRIRQAGWKVAYVPAFKITHVGGTHSVVTKVKSFKGLMRGHINRYYFIRKHYGRAALHVFRFIMSAGAMLRLLNTPRCGSPSPAAGRKPVPSSRPGGSRCSASLPIPRRCRIICCGKMPLAVHFTRLCGGDGGRSAATMIFR